MERGTVADVANISRKLFYLEFGIFSVLLFDTLMDKNFTWHKIADFVNELAFADNNIAIAELDGKKICIGKHQEKLFAFAHKCPHAGGMLADGHIDALGNVVCPLHRYRFNMNNGRNVSGEGYYLTHWPVEQRGDAVYVGIEEKAGFWDIFR